MTDDYPTPAGALRAWWQWFPAWVVILAAVLVVGGLVTYAGSALGWWLSAQNATHQAQNTQNGYSNQSTLRAQVTQLYGTLAHEDVQIAANPGDPSLVTELKTERSATSGQICTDAAQVTDGPLPAQQAQWASANCTAGTLSPQSPDYLPGAP